MKKKLFILSLTVLVILLLGEIPMIFAQESTTEEFILEEIVVTAQKRGENMQKVPIAMEVLSGEKFSESGQDDVSEILRNISSAIINMSSDGMRVSLRGIVEDDSVWNDMRVSTPTVAINIDGAYNSSSSAGQNMFDIERVEVLAGPQSTLYGSNSPGGIVNVVTAAPKTDKYSASASVEYGSFSLSNYQAVFNAPVISDKVAIRFAGQKSERGSWVDDGNNTWDTTTARLKTLWQPNDKFSSTVTLNWAEKGSGGARGGQVKIFDYQDGHYEDGTPVTNPWTETEQETDSGAMGQNQITKGINADISWDAGIGSLSIVSSYSNSAAEDLSEVDVRVGREEVVSTQYKENYTDQKSLEVRMTSPMDFPFKWITGMTYYKSDREDSTDDYYYDSNDQTRNSKQENKAIYGNITYPFTAELRGTVGYRRSWDSVSNEEIPVMQPGATGRTGQDYSNPDYKAGVEYDLADNSMLYASYATSYRVNGMMVAQGDKNVPPEKLKAYTVGVKNRFLNNRLQVNASSYYYDYSNKVFELNDDGKLSRKIEINEADYIEPGTNHGTDFNNDGDYTDTNSQGGDLAGMTISDPWAIQFGAFRSIGVDISTEWIITADDRLNLSVSYLNAKWTDALITYYWNWIWPDTDYSGMKSTYSPTWSVNASYEHNFISKFGTLVPHIDIQYKSDYTLSYVLSNYPYSYQEPHYLIGANVTFTHSSDKWSLNAYVKNATNYAVKTFWGGGGGNKSSLGVSDPRTYGVVFSIKL